MLKVIFVAFKFLQSLEIENTLKNSALIFFSNDFETFLSYSNIFCLF